MRFPVADEEVKVVRAIALREVRRIRRGLRVKRNCECHAESQAENDRHQGLEFSDLHSNFVPPRLS